MCCFIVNKTVELLSANRLIWLIILFSKALFKFLWVGWILVSANPIVPNGLFTRISHCDDAGVYSALTAHHEFDLL